MLGSRNFYAYKNFCDYSYRQAAKKSARNSLVLFVLDVSTCVFNLLFEQQYNGYKIV